MAITFSEEKAKELLENQYDEAETVLSDFQNLQGWLGGVRNKAERIAFKDERFKTIIIFTDIIYEYSRGTYRSIRKGSIIAMIGVLLYFNKPFDAIPDGVPMGYEDDYAVLKECLKFVDSDINRYLEILKKRSSQ